MKKIISICVVAVALAACAHTADRLNQGLPLLKGQKLDYAITYLGFPDAEQHIGGMKLYVWSNSYTSSGYDNVSTPSTGTFYGPNGTTNYTGQTSTPVYSSSTYKCQITLAADDNNLINNYNWKGDLLACRGYANLIDKLIADHAPMSK